MMIKKLLHTRYRVSDLEKTVLSRAVRWHVENRVLIFGRKTVIFD